MHQPHRRIHQCGLYLPPRGRGRWTQPIIPLLQPRLHWSVEVILFGPGRESRQAPWLRKRPVGEGQLKRRRLCRQGRGPWHLRHIHKEDENMFGMDFYDFWYSSKTRLDLFEGWKRFVIILWFFQG